MNFISREQVLAVFQQRTNSGNALLDAVVLDIRRAIEAIPSFPAPNPEMRDDRNVMGQTEEEFWGAVEAQEK